MPGEAKPGRAILARSAREIQSELDADERIVAEHGNWVAWVPFASAYVYGMRIAPRSHVGSLSALDDKARDDLAGLLIDVLGRYDRLWPPPRPNYRFPYMLWFHQAPAHGGDEWHVARAHRTSVARARRAPLRRVGRARERHALESGRARRRGASDCAMREPVAVSARRAAST